MELGFLIVSVTPLGSLAESGSVFTIDTQVFSLVDSIQLLKKLHVLAAERLRLLTVTSVFGSISAGLGIKNLQMWHVDDEAMPTMWYPVHHVVSHRDHPAIPESYITIANENDYTVNERNIIDYKPDFILQTFLRFFTA